MKLESVERAVDGVPFMTAAQGREVYEFVLEHRVGRILELGFAHGKSTCYFAAAVEELGGDGHIVTMDRESARRRSPNIDEMLKRCSLDARVTPIYAATSYTWELMKLIEQNPTPRFDFVYIDGGHTWDVTGYAFFLVDKLLVPGGWLLFDDLNWTLGGSSTMRSQRWVQDLPEDQRMTPQVRKVFELLVAQHPSYDEVLEDDGWGWARKRPSRRFSFPG